MEKHITAKNYLEKYNSLHTKYDKSIENLSSEIRIYIAELIYALGRNVIPLNFDFYDKDFVPIHCYGIEADCDNASTEYSSGLFIQYTYKNKMVGKRVYTRDNLEDYPIDLQIRILWILEDLLEQN